MSHTLILGGTGKTGRRIVERLAALGVDAVAGSRHPQPGLPSILFDWDDTTTHVLDDVDTLYLMPPALRVDHVGIVTAFIEQAASVRRVVFLSARGVDVAPPNPLRAIETMLQDSGLAWSVLRPTWFNQNFTEGVFAGGIADGVIVAPTGDGAVPSIDADDIADVAVALLTRPKLDGAAYDISGPTALSFAEMAAHISSASGRVVRHVELDRQAWEDGATGAGLPGDYAVLLGTIFDVIRNGWDAHISDGVEQVLGRAPRSFGDWANAQRW
jgi:uncharacterized protein YbjT (DUF2867 family)